MSPRAWSAVGTTSANMASMGCRRLRTGSASSFASALEDPTMNDVRALRTLAEIEEEAAIWVWRLDDESVSARVKAEFGAWLQADVRHAKAFDELGGVWRSLDQLSDAKRHERIATFMAEEQRLVGQAQPGRS